MLTKQTINKTQKRTLYMFNAALTTLPRKYGDIQIYIYMVT